MAAAAGRLKRPSQGLRALRVLLPQPGDLPLLVVSRDKVKGLRDAPSEAAGPRVFPTEEAGEHTPDSKGFSFKL